MTIEKFRRISLFALTSVLLAASLIWQGEQAAANEAEGYYVNVGGTHIKDVHVRKGKAYVPLKSLADAMGYEISYTLQEELDNFHQYDLKAASGPPVSVWGNDSWGYTIVRRATQEMSVNDIDIYKPARLCAEESDHCKLDKSKYDGPLFIKNTLYVPVRDMAKALNLKLTMTKTPKGRSIQLSLH
ncbi:hypothetical protein MHI43_30480 [Paenibacillus sp. FSL H8-0457]|uniref:hypothetical protein n=1 Tax=unclassified Paenibacillus TaxID=185978 RepID=UPI0001789013|nr:MULTISPECIES: hypothetical protein [unclassified Paenibacillus]ACX68218.1 hypothetical protein GYMC10_6013 [Paenibacillus sp. Y412MC10]ETT69155.1 hypothetical protein C172_00640 [Paenibacillus sp. FSL H8-457]